MPAAFFQTSLFYFSRVKKPCQLTAASFMATMTISVTGGGGLCEVFLSSEDRMLSTEFAINAL